MTQGASRPQMEQVSLPGAAIRAERPVRSADADPPLPAALGAFLKVGWIADQAAGADRLAEGKPRELTRSEQSYE
jgi:hypothetical protein